MDTYEDNPSEAHTMSRVLVPGQQCVECGYDLKGLPHDTRVCPECGRPISHEPIIEIQEPPRWWLRQFRAWRLARAMSYVVVLSVLILVFVPLVYVPSFGARGVSSVYVVASYVLIASWFVSVSALAAALIATPANTPDAARPTLAVLASLSLAPVFGVLSLIALQFNLPTSIAVLIALAAIVGILSEPIAAHVAGRMFIHASTGIGVLKRFAKMPAVIALAVIYLFVSRALSVSSSSTTGAGVQERLQMAVLVTIVIALLYRAAIARRVTLVIDTLK
jgi:hypothetical protein